jgi:hypothetical protein
VGHPEDLIGVFVQQKVVVAEMTARHMPVKVLSLKVETENISKQQP